MLSNEENAEGGNGMNGLRRPGVILAVVVWFFLIFSRTAGASTDVGTFDQAARAYYIGPGTITIIMQVLVGLLVGGAAMLTIYRTRVKYFLTNLFTRRKQDEESEESEESE